MFRKILFWLHLVAGLIAGLAIAIMCFTGTVLAFEKELVAWSERDARHINAPSADSPRLTLAQMQAKVRESQPDARLATVVFQNDPRAAVAFASAGRGAATFHVNPHTGEVRQPKSKAMAGFMHTMVELHRYLGFHGEESRLRGKLINGVCNLAFFVLAVTGLYLWLPRQWSWRALRPVVWFRQNATSKARDFNWHNAIGFWTAPVLIVLTLTAVPISFRWGGDVINTLTGTPAAPVTPGGPRGAPTATTVTPPVPDAVPLAPDALLAAAQKEFPNWKTITLRLGGAANTAANFTIREAATWPRTANTTLALDPFTGAVLQRTGYAQQNAAQQVRSWTRFLHTGEALGWVGQFVAGLACLGGCFLVYTGFALSWRRFFSRSKSAPAPTP